MARLGIHKISLLLQSQLIRFGLVGVGNTALGYGLYAVGIYIGLTYYVASLVALIIAIFVSFLLQAHYVFETQLEGRFLPYIVMWTALYLLNIGLIWQLATFGVNYYLAGLLAAFPVNTASFLLQKFVIFND